MYFFWFIIQFSLSKYILNTFDDEDENEIKSNLSSSYDDEYSNPPENAETIEKKEEKSEQNNSEIISHSE